MCRRIALRHWVLLLGLLAGSVLASACDESKEGPTGTDYCVPGSPGCPQ
ncbi:MAG: hypothetical protein U0133_11510 [Gemmatimonadales bacterium]